jgi:two-component system, NarL family, sensor histidine kinase FusK
MTPNPAVTSPASTDSRLWPLAAPVYWAAIPLVAFAYASVAAISLALAIPPGYASAVWPPAGIALAACLAFGGAIWPGILLGAAIANLGVIGTSVPVALAIGAGNAAEAALAGMLIQRFIGLRHRFEQPAAVWKFAVIAFGSALVAATNGVATLALAGQVPWAEFGKHWLTWWLGDATGIIIVAPLLLCWSEPGNGRTAGERRAEYQLFAALLLLCGVLVFAVKYAHEAVQTLAYLMIPMVTWAAARLDQRAVTAASFAISAVAVIDMLDGAAAMFSPLALNESLLLLQLFVSAVALTGLTLSAFAGEVARMNARLEDSHAQLQHRVKERTDQLERTLAQQLLLAKRMVNIRDEERKHLAADLHDGAAQDVTSLGVSLDLIRAGRRSKSPKWLDERVDEALAIAKRAGQALREVISGLRLPGLEGVALASALHRHAAEFEARTGILVNVDSVPSRDTLPQKVKDALLRIFLESLANVAKHADARAVRVTLQAGSRVTRLAVEDDGCGFDPALADQPDAQPGAGLLIMRERALALGGDLRVRSAPGAGTCIECTVATGAR